MKLRLNRSEDDKLLKFISNSLFKLKFGPGDTCVIEPGHEVELTEEEAERAKSMNIELKKKSAPAKSFPVS